MLNYDINLIKNKLFFSKRVILGGRVELFTMIFDPYMYTFPESGDQELNFGDEFSCVCRTVYLQDIPKVGENTEIRSLRSISPKESLFGKGIHVWGYTHGKLL